jgi:hypothetical protein
LESVRTVQPSRPGLLPLSWAEETCFVDQVSPPSVERATTIG